MKKTPRQHPRLISLKSCGEEQGHPVIEEVLGFCFFLAASLPWWHSVGVDRCSQASKYYLPHTAYKAEMCKPMFLWASWLESAEVETWVHLPKSFAWDQMWAFEVNLSILPIYYFSSYPGMVPVQLMKSLDEWTALEHTPEGPSLKAVQGIPHTHFSPIPLQTHHSLLCFQHLPPRFFLPCHRVQICRSTTKQIFHSLGQQDIAAVGLGGRLICNPHRP